MRKPLVTSLSDLKKKVQTKIICTDSNIRDIIKQEIEHLGNEADLNHLDVSRVTNMGFLFSGSKFNGDISLWDVSNVVFMTYMFRKSEFNGDISQWDVSCVNNMACMFEYSQFNQDISKWDVSNVYSMGYMFYKSDFNQDISNWKINPKCYCRDMLKDCPIKSVYKPELPKRNYK